MHDPPLDQPRVWLLAGTGDGPRLTSALLQRNWLVRVSVVSPAAAEAYRGLAVESMAIGALGGVRGIAEELKRQAKLHWVVDATHPFATKISHDLAEACLAAQQPLLRFERPWEEGHAVTHLLQSGADLSRMALSGQRLLLAVGGRHLAGIAASARLAGGDLFARAMPTRLGLRSALAAGLPPDHLAVVRPSQGEPPGQVERALCRRWGITAVVCRQSGGMTERLWRRIAEEQRLTLLLLRRPPSPSGVDTVVGEAAFLKWVDHG